MVLPERYSLDTPAQRPPWTPNPKTLLAIRIIFTLLVCLMALATAIMTAIIINYYLSHRPMIFPPLSSMIFILFMGIFTSIMYFGYYIFLPSLKMMRHGSLLGVLFTMKLEVLFQFAMAAIWISGALAYAADYRGHENCLWNGYYHYKKPDDWDHLCDMVNWVVGMAYATFGIQAAFLAFDLLVGLYLFMFVDQDSVSERFYEWGTRAWEFRHKPHAPLASVNNPMLYRANPDGRGATMHNSHRGTGVPYGYNEKYSDDATFRDSPISDDWSNSSSSHRSNRRGAVYSDPSMSEQLTDESASSGSRSNYYGGAYSRSSVNSRRAGLKEAPRPAGSGGTSSGGAPSWHAPTITDADSVRVPSSIRTAPRKQRHASAPQSLGSRGRRGMTYQPVDRELDTIEDESAMLESAESGDLIEYSDGLKEEDTAAGQRARRRHSVDGDDRWHLRDEMV